ncbi:MAG: hypothetical protein H2038_12785, partial [Brevundimonas sp.]|uniref:hypothetical protein n=1 Tax=Brevundimonas sp. TaxID=1871086 RepID=UPI0017B1230C
MRSPLKPLLCRHDWYWSERHRAERCRRCGKLGQVETGPPPRRAPPSGPPAAGEGRPLPAPVRFATAPQALRREAAARRRRLPELLERLADGGVLGPEETLDAVLAIIEDGHSAEPLLFGPPAAVQFARLREARFALSGGGAAGQREPRLPQPGEL